ncbi:developmental pluripotency-associated protein 4-like [Ctenodactylus gundi]
MLVLTQNDCPDPLSQAGSTGKSGNEPERMSTQPSTTSAKTSTKGTKRKRSRKDQDKGSGPKETAQDQSTPKKPRKKMVIPPLPAELPPVDQVHRDILRGWCQRLRLSAKGQASLKNIPCTSKEARVRRSGQPNSTRSQKTSSLEDSKERKCAGGASLPEAADTVPVPPADLTALEEPPALYEEVSTSMVTTPGSEAVLASWARIAASAGKVGTVEHPPEGYGDRWCVVHGRSLPADKDGWVQLQFHAGQAWVPEKRGRLSALFLLPACTFPPPHMQDNLLCPGCVHSLGIFNVTDAIEKKKHAKETFPLKSSSRPRPGIPSGLLPGLPEKPVGPTPPGQLWWHDPSQVFALCVYPAYFFWF